MNYDAIVVGGGVVGTSIAYHLVCAGARTLLLDRADAGRATDAGAGILTAETNGRASDAWLDFAVSALDYYPSLVEQLQAEQAGETGYAICGQIEVAIDEDEIAPFEQAHDWILAQQRRRGSPAPRDLFEISAEDARALFPALANVRRALYYRNAARVDGRLLTAALHRAGIARGLVVQPASVDRLVIEAGAVVGVSAEGNTYAAGSVAIAGGAWSPRFAEQLGVQIPVEPMRGQIIHLGLPGAETRDWPVITAYHGHYIVAWPDSRIVVGATREQGSGFEPRTTAAGIHEVLGEALRVAPGLRDAELREIRVGLRPISTVDGLPVLGLVPGLGNIVLATGHGASGLHLGPYSGKCVAELMLGQPLAADLSMFEVSRFSL
jgi:D-amino-acid dehydrogenase